jgi:hypothetical protein
MEITSTVSSAGGATVYDERYVTTASILTAASADSYTSTVLGTPYLIAFFGLRKVADAYIDARSDLTTKRVKTIKWVKK